MYERCLSIHEKMCAFIVFLSHYIEFRRRLPDLYAVPAIIPCEQGSKTVYFRFLNQINVLNVEALSCMVMLWKSSLKAANSRF